MHSPHPWHGIEVGEKSPKVVNMIVEIPKDSKVKYELDKETGMLKLDRFMYSAVYYPGDYGFIPKTLWEDGDPLDIIVFTNRPVYPMTLCEAKVIGVLHMVDDNESDDKIIAVYDSDPRSDDWNDIDDVPHHYLKELRHFFETYKDLQGRKVDVFEIRGPKIAYKSIQKGQKLYNEKYGSESEY